MKKKSLYLLKAYLLTGALCLNPIQAQASSNEENKFFTYGEKLYNWCEEVDKKINEKLVDPIKEVTKEIELFKQESLWLITDQPNLGLEEEHHYFFVDKNTPSMKKTTYYNDPGVTKSKKEGRYKEEKEMYVSINDIDEVFLMKTTLDHQTETFTKNYIDLTSEKPYDEETTAKYGRFIHFEEIIPESMIQEKYSKEDLDQIVNYLEKNLSKSLSLEKK